METELKQIKKDIQIKKFCAYGFLKNLRFFEPYLLIFLMSKDINLMQIGVLMAVREVIVNIFEIPSGFIADYLGRKKELYLCFIFYILSYVTFYFTSNFYIAIIAMALFGLGEAFRSGTHKAIIYSYLDKKGWEKNKTFVYGRTRSFSLVGSTLSSIIGIVLILTSPSVNLIFLFSIIPSLLDLLLIATYPKYLDKSDKKTDVSFKESFKKSINNFKNNSSLRGLLIEEGIYSATVSYIKDMIQPILKIIILGAGAIALTSLSGDGVNLKISLGIMYAILNIIGSVASKNSYLIKGEKSNTTCLTIFHLSFAVCMGILGIIIDNPYFVFMVYIVIYILFNIRKPIFVDEIDNHIEKYERATVLSVSSQLKSLFLIIFAPILGLIGDKFGLGTVMIVLSCIFFITLSLIKQKKVTIKE